MTETRDAQHLSSNLRIRTTTMLATMLATMLVLVAGAQAADVDGAGNLLGFPFDAPLTVTSESSSTRDGERVFVWTHAEDFERCVEAYRALYDQSVALADEWSISGYGYDPTGQAWRFGLLHRGNRLYAMSILDEHGVCRVELQSSLHPIPGSYYRFSHPPMRPYGTAPIDLDPLTPAQ